MYWILDTGNTGYSKLQVHRREFRRTIPTFASTTRQTDRCAMRTVEVHTHTEKLVCCTHIICVNDNHTNEKLRYIIMLAARFQSLSLRGSHSILVNRLFKCSSTSVLKGPAVQRTLTTKSGDGENKSSEVRTVECMQIKIHLRHH